ncbi:MAG: deoxyribose-phosphate aldolase, partial [Prevotellaceae bacterium]|nr:deoxyribose-phosphate aldolase [Prevotellaceae bacterium]
METLFETYSMEVDDNSIAEQLKEIQLEAAKLYQTDVFKTCLSCVDLTTLNSTDTLSGSMQLAEKVNQFEHAYSGIPNVASICVYPTLVNTVRKSLKAKGVGVTSVAAGFPSSQTYVNIKISECVMVVEHGANEVDVVISLGRFLDEDYQTTFDEITQIKDAVDKVILKVILETGVLINLSNIRIASIISMEAGADFIKTSTGKLEPAATPEAAIVMCGAIKDYYKKTGKQIGFKVAGGVVTAEDAVMYYAIVKHILGEEWLNPNLFRIGASR